MILTHEIYSFIGAAEELMKNKLPEQRKEAYKIGVPIDIQKNLSFMNYSSGINYYRQLIHRSSFEYAYDKANPLGSEYIKKYQKLDDSLRKSKQELKTEPKNSRPDLKYDIESFNCLMEECVKDSAEIILSNEDYNTFKALPKKYKDHLSI